MDPAKPEFSSGHFLVTTDGSSIVALLETFRFYRLQANIFLYLTPFEPTFDMPRVVQGGVVQAEQVMDLTAEPDDATEDEESGTLQDGVLDDDDEEEDAEAGKVSKISTQL